MKIIAVGMNYGAHVSEMRRADILPVAPCPDGEGADFCVEEPVLFLKADSLLREGHPFFYPDFSQEIHYETELVVRIDRIGKCIAKRFAHRYYSEVTVGIDFTARDLQRRAKAKGLPWATAKAFDNSAAVGRWVKKDSLRHGVQELGLRLDIDGRTVQQGNTRDMLFSVDRLIAYASRFFTLRMGDLIFTGTPAGVGPIAIGQHLEAYLEEQKLLDISIK
ncbi:fumarylacetoacetate hydrolase family protein [Porphyromonas gingivalis]|uniref:fumarylacetoacetate hydrolase family protein n=1 Tax=Porphyromonas gingivalis TaxID=837 RepID=UPI001F3A3D7F|nr:fumarylacetoacetate hydrolase family protein [Porphyromonas gingivalis]MCE8189055.1 fumarylacetoacetate hydrolase family protein [Porphyromonas gingivalis]